MAFEAKVHFSQLLRDVETKNDEIVIQRHHRNIATIIPFRRSVSAEAVDILGGFAKIRASQSISQEPVKNLVNEGRTIYYR